MSKCCKCGKELPENTQGTVCQECFWCSYKLNENKTKERKMSKNKVKVDCENCIFYDQQIQQKDRRIAELESEKQTDLGYIDAYETVYYGKEINKLAEYENTGLEPSEVEQLKAKLEIWNRFNKEDYIHKGEKATERDYDYYYYYYTNGASSVLENEVERLKANQNKVAIEKLEKLKIKLNDFKVDNFSDACIVIKDMNFNINAMLTELKGKSDE